MSLRPPKSLSGARLGAGARPGAQDGDDPLGDTLGQEILAEKFGTYARLVETLERAIAALSVAGDDTCEAARAEAARALYHVVVQRDILRLPATDRFLAELGVPADLAARVVPPRVSWRRRPR